MAIGPINYTAAQPQQDFLSSLQGGLQLGATLRNETAKAEAQQLALKQQQQMQSDLSALASNPNATGRDYAAMATRYPALAENLNRAWGTLSADQQQGSLSTLAKVTAALHSGRPEVGAQVMRDQAEALRNSGDAAGAKTMDDMARLAELDPDAARLQAGLMAAAIPGGDKILSGLTTFGTERRAAELQPFKTREAAAGAAIKEAEAGIKGIEAANAPTATALSNLTAQEKIETARAEREIARLDVQIRQANSETQRGELQLKRDELQAKLDEKRQMQGESAQDQLDTVRQSLTTVDTILKHPGATGFFYGPGTFGGKMSGYIPGTDRKDIDALVTTLKSQQFMTGIKQMQGMGALSNSEGDKIASAVASLDLDQTPGAFKNALGVIQRNLKQAEAKLLGGAKLPTGGGAFIMKHPTYGNVTEGQINRLMQQNPGSTREQVMQFLQSTGGQ